MNMEFQPLPPVSTMNLGGGPPTPSPSPHVQVIPNGGTNVSSNNAAQLLNSMPPPPGILPVGMPLQQVVHNLQHLTNVNGLNQQQHQQQHHQQQQAHQTLLGTNNTNGLNGIHQNQPLPPTSQLLQAIHHNQANNNNNNNNNSNAINNNNNNSITQYQVQQLWRHHAYLNGNVLEFCLKNVFEKWFWWH